MGSGNKSKKLFRSHNGSPDWMESLLKESIQIEQSRRRGTGSIKRLEEIQKSVRSAYANEANWLPSGIVQIIHTSEEGTQTTIGTFQEFTYKNQPQTRRLARVVADQSSLPPETKFEIVHNPLWINGRPVEDQISKPNSLEERTAIRAYLERTKPVDLVLENSINMQNLLSDFLKNAEMLTWQRLN